MENLNKIVPSNRITFFLLEYSTKQEKLPYCENGLSLDRRMLERDIDLAIQVVRSLADLQLFFSRDSFRIMFGYLALSPCVLQEHLNTCSACFMGVFLDIADAEQGLNLNGTSHQRQNQ